MNGKVDIIKKAILKRKQKLLSIIIIRSNMTMWRSWSPGTCARS